MNSGQHPTVHKPARDGIIEESGPRQGFQNPIRAKGNAHLRFFFRTDDFPDREIKAANFLASTSHELIHRSGESALFG
jgi:hypothetical protein